MRYVIQYISTQKALTANQFLFEIKTMSLVNVLCHPIHSNRMLLNVHTAIQYKLMNSVVNP